MIYRQNINANININSLLDLSKLKIFIEEGTLKINKSQIARELGVDRRTVAKYIDGYKKPSTRNKESYLDKFYDLIKELLSDKNQQIFYYKRVLWQYLKDNHGLLCAESSFRRYISKHPEFNSYFKKNHKGTNSPSHMRYETPAGKQAQLDWKESMDFILDTGEIVTINIFVLLLSYSRFRVYRLSLSKSQSVLFSFLDDAFETFGGVPEELLTDNMKTVMNEPRTAYSKGKINPRFEQFASDYGFKTKPCIAGRPQTKAKVEAPMKILDEIYAYNGKLNYYELNQLVEKINNRVNYEVNKGTGRIPIHFLQKEKAFLSRLPKDQIRKTYQISTQTSKVNQSSMITYLSNQYSVPPKYIGKRMNFQVYDNYLHVYYNTDLIVIHQISSKKLNYLESHYIEISKLTLNEKKYDIHSLAKSNLELIGERYYYE